MSLKLTDQESSKGLTHFVGWPAPYGIAVGSTFGAFLLRWFIDPYLHNSLPYLTFVIAVAVTSWYCGTGPSLVAFMLGGLVSNWFFIDPRHEFSLSGPVDQAGMAVYVTIGFALIGFIQTWRWAWKRTEEMTAQLRREVDREHHLEGKPLLSGKP